MSKNAIFIAATGQNVGKTTLCLGILAALKKRFSSVGFIKPVGQQHVKVSEGINVDKDALLFKQHFHLKANWEDMSPVIFPSGFTRDYLDGKVTEEEMRRKITFSFDKVAGANSYTVVEGTGNVGVGSIVNMNNAQTAKLLGLDMVIIASGGLGSAHDEIALNLALCEKEGVEVRGVILNKVLPDKREMILDYFPKTLKKWDIPLIGCIPFSPLLSQPTVKDFENLFNTTLLAGERFRYSHFPHTRLVAGSLDAFIEEMIPNELIITPASREDIIQAVLQKHIEAKEIDGVDFGGGLILTSRHPPSRHMLDQIRSIDVPVLYAPVCSYDAMKMITSYNAKIRWEDTEKVRQAINIVEDNINFDLLCEPLPSPIFHR